MENKKPDFLKMSLAEQLALYNELSETKRRSKFSSVEKGAAVLEAAWREKHPAEGKPATRETKMNVKKIKILTAENPRRKGSAGHEYYEAAKKSATRGDYVALYEGDKKKARDARLWLAYNIRDGHIELVG